jgi:hypothetical protein
MSKQKAKGKTPAALKAKYPGIGVWEDRHGKTRYRVRKTGLKPQLIAMGLEPYTGAFDDAYEAIVQARPAVAKADVIEIPTASLPQTFRHAWKLVLATAEWKDLDAQSQSKNERMAKEFLGMPINPNKPLKWGDVPVSQMTFEHLEKLRDRWAALAPSKPWHMKVMLRKIFYIARRKKMRDDDPTELVKWKRGAGKNGGYVGWKSWPEPIQLKFEARHAIGTAARTCYALAKWLGNRRGDIAHLSWPQLITVEIDGELVTGFYFEQRKRVQNDEDMEQFRPLTTMLADALEPLTRDEGTVLKTAYGKPFSEKSLTGMMAHWCKQADIPAGYTLHGLRKSYAQMVAVSGASFQMQKDMLGHTTMQQVVLYAKGLDKMKTTTAAAKLLEERFGAQRKPPRLRIIGE